MAVEKRSLSKIDESTIRDHYYINGDDSIFYFGEYISGAGFKGGEYNSLISNLKKDEELKVTKPGEYNWKEKAETDCAVLLSDFFNGVVELANILFIPTPPSKCYTDSKYDARLVRILKKSSQQLKHKLIFKNVVSQIDSMESSHSSHDKRHSPQDLIKNYKVDFSLITAPYPEMVCIFDDVITSGSHFRAMHEVLRPYFPESTQFIGIFIARRIFAHNTDLDDLDDFEM